MPPEPKERFLSRTTCDLQEMTVDSDGCVESFMISVTLLTICSAMCLPDGQVGRRDQGLLPHCVIGPLRGISLPATGRGSFLLGCWIRTERWRTRTRCCAVNQEALFWDYIKANQFKCRLCTHKSHAPVCKRRVSLVFSAMFKPPLFVSHLMFTIANVQPTSPDTVNTSHRVWQGRYLLGLTGFSLGLLHCCMFDRCFAIPSRIRR